jgi:hypothetical protein
MTCELRQRPAAPEVRPVLRALEHRFQKVQSGSRLRVLPLRVSLPKKSWILPLLLLQFLRYLILAYAVRLASI